VLVDKERSLVHDEAQVQSLLGDSEEVCWLAALRRQSRCQKVFLIERAFASMVRSAVRDGMAKREFGC
jgi:hypothetical protein